MEKNVIINYEAIIDIDCERDLRLAEAIISHRTSIGEIGR